MHFTQSRRFMGGPPYNIIEAASGVREGVNGLIFVREFVRVKKFVQEFVKIENFFVNS